MKLHRLAYSITVSLLIFLAILATVRGDGDPNPSEYSTTEKSRHVGSEILRNLNTSINPCNNFHAHVCAGPAGWHLHRTDIKIQKEITELFENIQPGDMEALRKAKKFQDACTNRDAIRRRGLKPIETILSDNGEWPITPPSDKWNNQYRSWQEMHENFAKNTGVSALFDVTAAIDRRNTSVHILSLGVPKTPSEEKFYFTRTKRETRSSDYREYLTGVVEELKKSRGFDVQYDDLLADPEGVIEFEDELVKLAIDLDKDYTENDDDLRITTIETLQNDWDAVIPRISKYSINWLAVINDRFEGTDIVVNASEKIALKPAAFVANFSRVLMNTPRQTIVNYVHWKVIDNLRFGVDSKFWNPHAGPLPDTVSYQTVCIASHRMIHAVAYTYVKKHLSVRSRTAALEIVHNLKDEIKRELRESTWLDEATKLVARKKIDAMREFVGYPEWYDEPGKIDEYYREFTVGPDHFENYLAYNKFEMTKQLSKLRSLVDETETKWIALPYIANAEYLPQPNALSIPASILQLPFFDYERPWVLNYGSLGSIVGHEISHGLDNLGRLYDANGIKRKWWSQSAIDTFKTKAQCFVKQYDKYTVDMENKTVHLNGTETQAENIADTMGFRASLRAYQRLRNNGKINNLKIQLLSDFTDEQLYFYELAYTFCDPDPISFIETGSMESHSPYRLRVIGALSNMQEFADAFHCPLGSPMNPPEKCLIWD